MSHGHWNNIFENLRRETRLRDVLFRSERVPVYYASRNLAEFACTFVLSACGGGSKRPTILLHLPIVNATIHLPVDSVVLDETVTDIGLLRP